MSKEPIQHPPKLISALPELLLKKCATKIAFAENQLSPKTFSLSLPTASHPNFMQQTRVRPFYIFLQYMQPAHG